MNAKILITGLSNTGKTTLIKDLKDTLVFARDGKPFSLELPHVNVPDYENINEFIDLIGDKLEAYKTKTGDYPSTVVFDSVSRIFTDIETYCNRKYKGFDIWANINKEINQFLDAIAELQDSYNVVLIAHITWDPEAKKYIETCKGSFGKIGGFLSTVDYALNIDIVGNKRIITHKGSNLARTLIEDIPEKEDVDNFNLQNYLDKIKNKSEEVAKNWSI